MMEIAPWLVLAPGTAIFVVVLAANYFGDIVRDSTEGRPVHGPRNWHRLGRRTGTPSRSGEPSGPMPTAGQDLVTFDSVTVDVTDPRSPYFGRRILDGVSLAVGHGECVGLIGESGSGKSTLSALALGLIRPPLALTGGSVSLFGAETESWSGDDWRDARSRTVCLINQDPLSALNPILRIGQQIGEVMEVHSSASRSAIDARVREVIGEVRLAERVIDQYPHELSGGMRQRVVIAMGLVNRPSLLIADEPTTALDVSTQIRILDLLRDLQGRYGLGLLFVSHDQRVVSRVADRVVILKEGRVVEAGLSRSVFTNPREPYTRELIAAIPGQRRQTDRLTGT
ncbi:MAG: ATP-binding cassette domain-containing protein [Pseudomonadota bacterium]